VLTNLGFDHLMYRHCVEQFVGDEYAAHAGRHRSRRRLQAGGQSAECRRVGRARRRARLDEMKTRVRREIGVTVDGAAARYVARPDHVVVTPRRPIKAAEGFRVVVSYAGRPQPVPDGDDECGWEELDDGVLVAGQTNGAPSWFP